MFLSATIINTAQAKNDRIKVRLEGPTTVDWGSTQNYRIVVIVDGKKWKALPLVKWRIRDGGLPVSTDRRNTSGKASVRTGDPKQDFYSRDFTLEAKVIAETPAGQVKRVVRLKITASNVARLCDKLGRDIKKGQEDLQRLKRRRQALQQRHDALIRGPTQDRAALDAANKALNRAQRDLGTVTKALQAARALIRQVHGRQAALNRMRWTAWNNMTNLARYTAANDRWAASKKTDRDKLAYIQTVFGRRSGHVRTTQNKAQLDADFDIARKQAKRHVSAMIGKALGGLGLLSVIALPGPGADKDSEVAEYAHILASAYGNVQNLKFYYDLNKMNSRLALSNRSLNALSTLAGRVRGLAKKYRSTPTDRLFRLLMVELKKLNNKAIDALHRNQDVLDEARAARRAAAKAVAEAKRDVQAKERLVREAKKNAARSRREAAKIKRKKRQLDDELYRSDRQLADKLSDVAAMQDRYTRHCEVKKPASETEKKPAPEKKVKCARGGLVGNMNCVGKHIEKGR